MGCFNALKYMKKKGEKCNTQHISHSEHASTALPQLETQNYSMHTSMKSIQHNMGVIHSTRTRALSTRTALDDAAAQETLASIELEEKERSKSQARLSKELHSPSPQPLPLPFPQGDAFDLFHYEEQVWSKTRDRLMKKQRSSSSQPLPLPSPIGRSSLKASGSIKSGKTIDSIRYFPYEEIAAACLNFSSDRCISECLSSTIYKASFGIDSSSKKLKATVTCLQPSTRGLREFMNEVNTLASLQHPNLCKLLGFHARDGYQQRILVYERLSNGSLDRLLFRRSDGPSIDWNSRMKIAICAAQGLTFLHEEGPFQAMYNDFSAVHIQIDKDFNAKLTGYGFVGHIADEDISSSSSAAANLSVETLEKGMLTPKSIVWSFGIVLLELLTGRKNLDNHLPEKERSLVKWCRPFVADNFQLSAIMDSQLKGRFSPKAARTVAGIVQRCLQRDPSERPTMRAIVENLKIILDMQYPNMCQEHQVLMASYVMHQD
uniref:Probable serine/threonine-protein kinase PBL1 n=1 Tax=Cicer arietinum TaxID=3827 RepID=A0A3Q7XRN1_CICAR|nr:probable serine/threonine-protein kinase PBL1 [Cicer arietinum]